MTAIPTRVRQLVNGVWQYVTFDEGGGGGGGGIPDPITDPLNIATTDASKVPLKITLPADFDQGAYDAIEIENSDGLRLLSFDVGGAMFITADATIGVPTVGLAVDGSSAQITLQQGSDTSDTDVVLRPGAGQSASVQVLNENTSVEHTLSSAGTAGSGLAGFYGHSPIARQTGVAVDAAAIHAALVNLGLITA